MDKFNKTNAETLTPADLEQPVIIAMVDLEDGPDVPTPMPIDGYERLWRAHTLAYETIPVVFLTPKETTSIRRKPDDPAHPWQRMMI